jgi:hypothetical protein
MWHRCYKERVGTRPSCASLSLLMTLAFSGCGQQAPAFRDSVADAPSNAAGIRAKVSGSSSSEDDAVKKEGEGPIDPEVIDAARDQPKGSPGDQGNSEPSLGPSANSMAQPENVSSSPDSTTRDNRARIVTGNSIEGGFGSESALPINWRTVQLTQGGPGKVDLLWVVDTSGSMSEEQGYLATNFNALIGALSSAGQDFQTAVTTTDICQDQIPDDLAQRVCPVPYGGTAPTHLSGSFVGDMGRKVLKRGDADLIQRFNDYTRLGVNGSGFEHGLKAAEMGIAKALSGANESLVRNDAFLAVIVVSDEEDDGIGLSKVDAYNGHNFVAEGLTTFRYTEDDLVTYLKTNKGQGNFSISAITPTRLAGGTLCSAPHTQPLEEGTQYIAAAQKTGGIVQSICDTNWNQSLALLGADLSSQISQVVLPSTPDPATIKVKVDGVDIKAWSYVPANNAVKFNTGSVPQKGANIVVGYVERK